MLGHYINEIQYSLILTISSNGWISLKLTSPSLASRLTTPTGAKVGLATQVDFLSQVRNVVAGVGMLGVKHEYHYRVIQNGRLCF